MVEIRRGVVVIVTIPGGYGKPRPAVIVQADRFSDDFESILVCPVTSNVTPHSVARIPVAPSPRTGLMFDSNIMVDKLSVIAKTKISRVVGRLDESILKRVDSSLAEFLGLQ